MENVARKRKASLMGGTANGVGRSGTRAAEVGALKPHPLVGAPPATHAAFVPVRRGLLYSPVVMRAVRVILYNYAEKVRGGKNSFFSLFALV